MKVVIQQFLIRWIVNFFGIWAAAYILAGHVTYQDHIRVLIWAALIFSIVNALIRPLVILLTLPAIVLTLGILTLFINAAMLFLVTKIYPKFHIVNYRFAILAVIIVWLVNYLLNSWLEMAK